MLPTQNPFSFNLDKLFAKGERKNETAQKSWLGNGALAGWKRCNVKCKSSQSWKIEKGETPRDPGYGWHEHTSEDLGGGGEWFCAVAFPEASSLTGNPPLRRDEGRGRGVRIRRRSPRGWGLGVERNGMEWSRALRGRGVRRLITQFQDCHYPRPLSRFAASIFFASGFFPRRSQGRQRAFQRFSSTAPGLFFDTGVVVSEKKRIPVKFNTMAIVISLPRFRATIQGGVLLVRVSSV